MLTHVWRINAYHVTFWVNRHRRLYSVLALRLQCPGDWIGRV